ncbi:hypothetical protein ACFQ0B_42030 [Nonomuraea thailandensis]
MLAPAIGAVIDLYLLTQLDAHAITLGLVWLAVGVIYLAYLTRMFRVPPPELDFAEQKTART